MAIRGYRLCSRRNFLRCRADVLFWERFNRPFTHWRWWVGQDRARWELQEFGTDEICVPTRGSDWYNGAVYQKFHHHEFGTDMVSIETGWTNFSMGVALAWDAMEDLAQVDFDALGFEEGTYESMVNQMNTLAASFYLDGLDFFGGVPLYKTTQSDVLPRSTDVETFHFIDSLLTQSLPNLPVKTVRFVVDAIASELAGKDGIRPAGNQYYPPGGSSCVEGTLVFQCRGLYR